MFNIYACFYEDMTKRCQNLISLGSHCGKTVVGVYSSRLCFVRTVSATWHGLAFYLCAINMTVNPKDVMTYEV